MTATLTDPEKHHLVMNNLEEASQLRREGRGWKYIKRYLKAQDPRWTFLLLWQLEKVLKVGGLNPIQEIDNFPEIESGLILLGQRDKAAQQLAQTCANTHIDDSEAERRMVQLHSEMEQPLSVSIQNDEDFDFYTLEDSYRWLWRFYRFDYILGDGSAAKHEGSGRPSKITLKDKDTAFGRYQEGKTVRTIALELNISVGSVFEIIKEEKRLRRQ